MDPVSSNWPHVLGLPLVFCGTLGIFKSSCSACFISARPTAEGWLRVGGVCVWEMPWYLKSHGTG